MESVSVILMIAVGCGIAFSVMVLISVSKEWGGEESAVRAPERDQLAASLLYQILTAGGTSSAEAMRAIRREGGAGGPVTSPVDVSSWGSRFAQLAPPEGRERLLETAVLLVSRIGRPVPLLQYVTLLDLCFALGFRMDALARLREKYRFEYVDPARAGRPDERFDGMKAADESELLTLLEISGKPDKAAIVAAYRKIAGRHHPDRHHQSSDEERQRAAARFIEVTRAYETLLANHSE